MKRPQLFLTALACLLLVPSIHADQAHKHKQKPQPKTRTHPMPKLPDIGPKINVSIPAAGQAKWHASKMPVRTLAAKIAKAMGGLNRCAGRMLIHVVTPAGHGDYRPQPPGYIKIQDQTHYRIYYTVPIDPPVSAETIANGATKVTRVDTKFSGATPVNSAIAAAKGTPDQLLTLWTKDFPRMVFQGITDRIDAWAPVLGELAKGSQGYQVRVEERRLSAGKKHFFHYRIVAVRSAAVAKKLGASEIEMVIDGNRFLPNTIRSISSDLKKKEWRIQWSCDWAFGGKFSPAEFVSPVGH